MRRPKLYRQYFVAYRSWLRDGNLEELVHTIPRVEATSEHEAAQKVRKLKGKFIEIVSLLAVRDTEIYR